MPSAKGGGKGAFNKMRGYPQLGTRPPLAVVRVLNGLD